MSRRQFAKYIKVPYIRYRLVEMGYLKPSKKDVANISKNLNVEFDKYLEGPNGYPTELPDKKPNKLVRGFYRLLGIKATRLVLVVLSVVFTAGFITGNILLNNTSSDTKYYTTEVIKLRDDIIENGSVGLSLTGEITYPQIAIVTHDGDNDKEVKIKGSFNTESVFLEFTETYWFGQNYRLHFRYSSMRDDYVSSYDLRLYSYQDNDTYFGLVTLGNGEIPSKCEFFSEPGEEITNLVNSVIDINNNNFNDDFEQLIEIKLGYHIDFEEDIALSIADTKALLNRIGLSLFVLIFVCLVLGAISIFGAYFCYIYGTKSRETKVFEHTDALLGFREMKKPMKRDIRFIPLLPETFLELVGIAIVAIGSLRIALLASSLVSYDSSTMKIASGELLTLQMLGMFLLYFIDFDIFADDRRVLRNVLLYPLLFFIIYYVECAIMSSVNNSGTLIAAFLSENFLIPNPFFSVTCYYALMMFLFYTPKFIKTKRGLIIYRSMGALPVIYIFVAFLISNGNTIFGWKMDNVWLRYLFTGERLPFSMLAVGYLVGLFFLRLYFKHKYGEENAKKYFMGNRYIFIKNIMTIAIVVIVFLFDLCFAGQTAFNKVGLGVNKALLILIPFLLLYHPHKGPRNLFVDYLTLFLYFLALAYAYVLAALLVLMALV